MIRVLGDLKWSSTNERGLNPLLSLHLPCQRHRRANQHKQSTTYPVEQTPLTFKQWPDLKRHARQQVLHQKLDQCKGRRHHKKLRQQITGRVYKLWQKGAEEQQYFGV